MFDARPAPARRRFPAWFLGLGLLLGLNLLVLLYVLLRDERAVAPVAQAALGAQAAPEATSAPAAVTPPPVPAETPPVITPTPAARAAAAVTATTTPPVAAPPALANPRARSRDDLLAAGGTVPEVQVALHVYDADPAKRFVFLNGQRLREGDVGADGLRVERIEADGVVLDHRGSAFKVPLEP